MIVAIDIGTTKICVLIAQLGPDGNYTITGIGKSPSHGLARGVVVDLIPASASIKSAIKEAELMAGHSIESAVIGISGSHIHAGNSLGMISLASGKVTDRDVAQVLKVAQAIPLPSHQQILHVLPQFYTIDGDHMVHDPRGMFGKRLEVQAHIISGAVNSVQNLVRCCELAGVKVQDIVLEPIASAHAVLTQDELEMGVALLDIGGGTSDFAIYQAGTLRHTKVFPYAGNLFTQDISLVLRITKADAERIKREYGAAHMQYVTTAAEITAQVVHGDERITVSAEEVYAVLECRLHELLSLIRQELHEYRQPVPAGLVITGGGSLLQGIQERAHEILQVPVRIGKPRCAHHFKQMLEHPMYATGYGLLLHALKKNERANQPFTGNLAQHVFSRMKSWIFDFL